MRIGTAGKPVVVDTVDGCDVYKSTCRNCHGGCGVLVYKKDGKIVKIKGNPEHPLNKGKLCVKGTASIENLYNPKRLQYPMKRVGKRGEGRFERITWDEALDTIVGKIKEIRDTYGIESIGVGQGTGRSHYHHTVRFANALGTPNWSEPGLAQCFIPRIMISIAHFGDLHMPDYYGDVAPECLMFWGCNPFNSGPDGRVQWGPRECVKKGPKIIVIDPRETELARKADLWLQVRPGTDDALAMGMLHVIINEDLYDKDFVEKWCLGFNELAERVRECTPDWAEKITWVPADQIRAAARLYATSKPAAMDWGLALEQHPNCIQTVRAVSMFPALTGNIDVPGGNIMGTHATDVVPYLLENIAPETLQKRMGAEDYKVLVGAMGGSPGIIADLGSAHVPTMFNAMRTCEPYPLKGFLIFGNNGVITYGESKKIYESLMSLDFLSVMDIYMTPTAALADIVLPAATWLERDQVQGFPFVAETVAGIQQKLVTMWECRPDEEVFIDIARRLRLDVGTESLEELYNNQLTGMGITFDELRQTGFAAVPFNYRKYEEAGFMTDSGKIELYSHHLESLGYDPLPVYEEPPESPYSSSPELLEKYPFVFTSGGRIQEFFNSEHRQVPKLRKRHPDPIVEINRDKAAELGIDEGDWVWIESPRGRIQQRAKLTNIDPRVVSVQHGWWFPEEEGPEFGMWKSNANVLTSIEPPYDPAMGTYQLRGLLCNIYK